MATDRLQPARTMHFNMRQPSVPKHTIISRYLLFVVMWHPHGPHPNEAWPASIPSAVKSTSIRDRQQLTDELAAGENSGTRREDLLIEPDLLTRIWILRKLLHPMDELSAIEFMLDKMKNTKSNDEFFNSMKR